MMCTTVYLILPNVVSYCIVSHVMLCYFATLHHILFDAFSEPSNRSTSCTRFRERYLVHQLENLQL